MRRFKLLAVLLRVATLFATAGIVCIASIDNAAAQSRLFSCPHGRVLEVTVTGPNSISAGPIEGKTLP